MPNRYYIQTRPYRIGLYDQAGEYDVKYFKHFESMLNQAIKWHKKYPGKTLDPSNVERADANFDGLTEDERERFWEVLSANA